MTTISILNGDFEILFADEVVGSGTTGLRMIRRAAGASATVYTTLALYSDVAANADAFQAMGFRNPMLPTTPNEFTLENQYFMPRSSTEWLKEGTIKANWSYTATPDLDGNGVVRVPYTGGTNFVAGDIGRKVVQGGADSGTLLDFEIEPDGTTVAWIRPDDSTPVTGDLFDGTGALVVTGGTGSTTSSTAGTIGATQYTAFQAIGSVPTSTEVYIYQNRLNITDSTGGFQWWTTDPTQSLGIISVLLRTQQGGNLVAKGDVEVFARRYTSLYDNFRLNVSAGGFAALPLASAADINNTTGYQTFTGSAGSGAFLAGEEITEAVSGAQGVVTAVGGTVGAPIIEYYLIADTTIDIFSSGAQTVTSSGTGSCTSAAPTANPGGPTETGAGNGGTVTIVAGDATADHDGDGTVEVYAATVDAQGPGGSGVPVAQVYERIKYVTRRGATTDLFTGMNQPGESYRGAEALYYYDNPTGTMTETDDLSSDTGDWTARLMSAHTTTTGQDVAQAFVVVTDQQTSLDFMLNDYFIIDEGADQVQMDTGGAGGAFVSLSSPKSSPFGTFTGSQLFGAPAILFTGQADADTQAYTLTDALGNLRTSPNTVTLAVENTVAGDRVYVARDTGVAGIIDKDQFGGLATPAAGYNQVGDFFLRVGTAISTDPEVPDVAYVRVIENTLLQEHHYVYDALDNTNEEFDLRVITGAAATAGTSSTKLFKTGGPSFITEQVEIGMLIQDTTNTGTYEVVSIDSADELTIFHLYGADLFASGDSYTINALIQTYANTDDIHDLIIDREATGTSESNTFIKTTSSPFGVVVNVRNGKNILPFTINQTVGDNGATITTVRQPDTIAV